MSFSGLKTAVRLTIDSCRAADGSLPEAVRADIAASFQAAVVETLTAKCQHALEATGLARLVVAGGVGANRALRASLAELGRRVGARVYYPKPALCTDNGAMIAYAGWCRRTAEAHERAHRREAAVAARRARAAALEQRTTVDKIFLRELRIETIIGFWEWERRIKQVVTIDLEIGTDASVAAASDAIAGTLNYEQLAKRLSDFVGDVAVSDGRGPRDGHWPDRRSRVRRAVGQGVRREARRGSGRTRGRDRHRAYGRRLCLRFSSGPAAMPIPNEAPLALAELERRFGAVRCSSVYRSAAIGAPAADYLNLVAALRPSSPSTRCASSCGRSRRSRARRADAAVCELDLDLLMYGRRVDAAAAVAASGPLRAAVRAGAAGGARARARASRHGRTLRHCGALAAARGSLARV